MHSADLRGPAHANAPVAVVLSDAARVHQLQRGPWVPREVAAKEDEQLSCAFEQRHPWRVDHWHRVGARDRQGHATVYQSRRPQGGRYPLSLPPTCSIVLKCFAPAGARAGWATKGAAVGGRGAMAVGLPGVPCAHLQLHARQHGAPPTTALHLTQLQASRCRLALTRLLAAGGAEQAGPSVPGHRVGGADAAAARLRRSPLALLLP
eukprot:2056363-Rhodomonas_salina.1